MRDGCGATMSDEDNDYDSDYGSYDCNDSSGFGPLVPSETERTLMERVRQELKHDLKQARSENPPNELHNLKTYFKT